MAADLRSDVTPAEREWAARRWFGADAERKLKLYVSFGTAIWMSRTTEALSALQAVAAWAGRQRGVRVVISLGGAEITNGQRQELERSNVSVARYIDQWSVLASADLFLTHHGLNSTHEAIAHEVPMVSYPFVWDQPGLAATCQRLGLAVGLVGDVMAAVQPRDLDRALTVVLQNRPMMNQALGDAHEWERTGHRGPAPRPAAHRGPGPVAHLEARIERSILTQRLHRIEMCGATSRREARGQRRRAQHRDDHGERQGVVGLDADQQVVERSAYQQRSDTCRARCR